MLPAVEERNFTPSSICCPSKSFSVGGSATARPDAHGGRRRSPSRDRPPGAGDLEVAAVVDGPREDRDAAGPAGVHAYDHAPRPVAGCQVSPAVDGNLDGADEARRRVGGGALDVTAMPAGTVAPFAGDVMPETGGAASADADAGSRPACSVAGWAPMSASRFTVACCMSTLVARRRPVVVAVEPPGPLDRPRTEHERPVRSLVEGRGGASRSPGRTSSRSPGAGPAPRRWPSTAARARPAGSRCRGPRPTRSRACRPGRPDLAPRQRRRRWACCARSASGRRPPGTGMRVVRVAVDGEDRPGERVLRAAAVGGRREPRVAPGARPLGRGVDLRALVGLLVADERAVARARAVDARLPARLPEDLVAAEEGEVHRRRLAGERPSRACSTFARCCFDQYSSCPTER